METLFRTYNRLVQQVDCRHLRYLYNQIDWKDRLVGIKDGSFYIKCQYVVRYISCFKKSFVEVIAAIGAFGFAL